MKIETLFAVAGKRVLITGGASGIGLAIAEAMAGNGARVALIDLDRGRLDAALAQLSALDGAPAPVGAQADVADAQALGAAFERCLATLGGLDVVFVNAGIGGGPGWLRADDQRNPERLFEDLPHEQWNRVMQVNVDAAFQTMQLAVRAMKQGGGGRIVVTASCSASKVEQRVGTPYVVSKAAVGHLVRQAALELVRYGITVNAIAPGPFITNISGGRLRDPDARAPFERDIPMHRLGEAADVQGVALFLASPASRYMTGAQVLVDGGFTLGLAD